MPGKRQLIGWQEISIYEESVSTIGSGTTVHPTVTLGSENPTSDHHDPP